MVYATSNFARDLRKILLGLMQPGCDKSSFKKLRSEKTSVLFALFRNWQNRRIVPGVRTVILSKQISEYILTGAHNIALKAVIEKIENGSDLQAHLSKRVGVSYSSQGAKMSLHLRPHLDLLLSDWGVNHLHLYPNEKSDAGSLLVFAMFKGNTAYLLDVKGHVGADCTPVWEDDSLVKIAIENWPEVGLFVKLHGMQAAPGVAPHVRRVLRGKGYNSMIFVDGTPYMPGLGSGIVGGGLPISLMLEAERALDAFLSIEQKYKTDAFFVAVSYKMAGLISAELPSVELAVLGNSLWVIDRPSRTPLEQVTWGD